MTRIPRAIAGRDIRSLPLGPAEAFLLSRIDAATDEGDLALMTGLSLAAVEAALNRLFDLGAIDFVRGERGGAPPAAQASSAREAASPSAPSAMKSSEAPRYNPAELDEDVELDRARRQRVLDVFYRLGELSHYELLRVDRAADRKQIKSAYYELAPEFHTDTYFGKRLGSYKAKIEEIFSQITRAHDVLTHRDRRADYDRELARTEPSRPSSAPTPAPPAPTPAPPAPTPAPPAASTPTSAPKAVSIPAYGTVNVAPRQAQAAASSTPLASPSVSSSVPPPPAPSADRMEPGKDSASERARRDALAKKLSGGYRRISTPGMPAVVPGGRVTDRPPPSDAEQRRQQTERAERALRQGHYEAGEGRWAEAAVSFEEACRGLPTNAGAHERAAFAVLRGRGSPAKAIELARRAVELDPAAPEYRLTLARAYFAEGMERRARTELEQAAALASGDARIKRCIDEIIEQAQRRGKVG